MNLVNLDKIKSEVLNILNEQLNEHLTYHNTAHTLYVLEMAEVIAKTEGVTGNNLVLLKIASLFHDIGFVNSNVNHEHESCLIAKELLPKYGLSQTQISAICGMIMATKIPQMPKTKLEEIIADADLEYLGTNKYESISAGLFNELAYLNQGLSEKTWLRIQIKFIEKHRYFTSYCLVNKQPVKLYNLNSLKERLRISI